MWFRQHLSREEPASSLLCLTFLFALSVSDQWDIILLAYPLKFSILLVDIIQVEYFGQCSDTTPGFEKLWGKKKLSARS